MSHAGSFKLGADPRRNLTKPGAGLVSAERLRTVIRRGLGSDAPAIVERVRVLALAGDPGALLAAATLLGAVVPQPPAAPTGQ